MEGDASDGMYVIRKGEVLVYLEKSGAEIKLATLGPGAMLGEMALFDKKPRSASAKATLDAEVTKITLSDFEKLMKQIPKWFVGLMATLSSRLRETNERLQALQNQNKKVNPLITILKVMNVVNLVWHKDGTKDDKSWLIDRETVEQRACIILDVDPKVANKIIQACADSHLFSMKKNAYKKDVLSVINRGVIDRFEEFAREFLKNFPDQPGVPRDVVSILECANKLAAESAYEVVTLSIDDLTTEGERRSLNVANWNGHLKYFTQSSKIISLVKASDGKPALKITDKKALPRLTEQYATLAALRESGVT